MDLYDFENVKRIIIETELNIILYTLTNRIHKDTYPHVSGYYIRNKT